MGNNGPKSTGEGELICGRNSYPFIAAFLRAHLFCPIPGDPCRAWNPATVAFPSWVESPHLPASPRAARTSPDSRAKATAAGGPRGCSSPEPKSSRAEPWGSCSHLDAERPLGAASATTTEILRAGLGVLGQLPASQQPPSPPVDFGCLWVCRNPFHSTAKGSSHHSFSHRGGWCCLTCWTFR